MWFHGFGLCGGKKAVISVISTDLTILVEIAGKVPGVELDLAHLGASNVTENGTFQAKKAIFASNLQKNGTLLALDNV